MAGLTSRVNKLFFLRVEPFINLTNLWFTSKVRCKPRRLALKSIDIFEGRRVEIPNFQFHTPMLESMAYPAGPSPSPVIFVGSHDSTACRDEITPKPSKKRPFNMGEISPCIMISGVHLVCGFFCFRAGKNKPTQNSHVVSRWCFVGVSQKDNEKHMSVSFVARKQIFKYWFWIIINTSGGNYMFFYWFLTYQVFLLFLWDGFFWNWNPFLSNMEIVPEFFRFTWCFFVWA